MGFIADDFAKPVSTRNRFPFGLKEPKELADTLREFASAVESGEILIIEARAHFRAKESDFTTHSLILRYVEKCP